jgi:iron complex transport system ATP-binding protein
LSGGEKQRVHLARIFAQIWDVQDAPNSTRLLVLDEPTTALDLGHQRELMATIRSFAAQNVAVLMVLHNLNLAAHNSDKLLALLDGKQVAFGDPESVMTQQNVELLFGTDIEMLDHPNTKKPIIVNV